MSLLMDALRKAEEAKRQAGQPAAPAEPGELTLTPLSARQPAATLPELAPHLDAVDAELAASARDAPATRRATAAPSRPPEAAERERGERAASARSSVRNAFSAKTTPRSRRVLWLALALGGGAAVGLFAYFWWQLQAPSNALRPMPAPIPSALAPAPTPTPTPPLTPAPIAEAAPASAMRPEPPPPAATAAPGNTAKAPALFVPRPARSSPAASANANPLRLSRSSAKPPLELAYAALQAGQLDAAQRDYEQVLRSDGKNTDALLGLATIAARQGQNELAQGYYRRALDSDPNDATAQAGLINTRGQADPGLSESRLKSALAGQPDSVALHFALGNVYSRQARWSEAQQAYFRAYAGEPDNADFIFNLAVSLDHLHQNKLAAQYYQMALNTANGRPGSFDSSQVKRRIEELRP